jgi:hypothetical protein
MMHVTSITEEYILYEVPIKIDGRLHNLAVAYDVEDEKFRMLTARLDESETGGVPGKDERLLAVGDEVTTCFFALDHENANLVPFEDETFKITEKTAFDEMELPDGTYTFMFLMTDYRDETYSSGIAGIIVEDGGISVCGPKE